MSQKYVFGVASLLLVLFFTGLVVAACGGAPQQQAPAGEAMSDEAMAGDEMMAGEEKMAGDEMMTGDEEKAGQEMHDDEAMAGEDEMAGDEMMAGDEEMAGDEMMTGDEEMAGEEMHDDEAMAGEEEMTGEEMMDLPAWFETGLTNVNTGETFKITDFQGKVVLVETMAVWCSNCLRQQREVQALHELLGEQPDLVSVALDIDPNETHDILAAFTGEQGFDWVYAVAPAEVAREIGQLYGGQFLNPPATPMLIIDRHGQAHPLPFGHKTAASLQEALAPFLAEAG